MSDRFRFGFNINGGHVGDENYFLDFTKALNPAWVLVMSNDILADKITNITNGNTEVIARYWSGDDGSQWQHMSPRDYANSLMVGNKHHWKYILNEPWAKAPEIPRMANWIAEVVSIMVDNGYKVIAPNFPPGNGETWQIDNGYFDNLLKTMATYKGRAMFATHEYSGVTLPSGVGTFGIWDLLDKDKLHPDNWPDVDDLGNFTEERRGNLWHLLRSTWFTNRAKSLGLGELDVVITEFGWDRMVDMTQGQNHIFDALEKRYGVAGNYSTLQGPYSLANIWDYYWSELGWSTSRAIVEQLKWADSIYPDNYQSMLPFMWTIGENGDVNWSGDRGYDYANDKELHQLLLDWSAGIQEEPEEPVEPPVIIGDTDTMIDLLEYVRGDGRVYELSYDFPGGPGTGIQVLQTDREPNSPRFFQTKGFYGYPADWEEMWYDATYVYRGTDISPSQTELYQTYENGEYGQKWSKRFIKVGSPAHLAVPEVIFRYNADGRNVPNKDPYLFPHYIQLKNVYAKFTFQSGITLNNVIELHGFLSDGNDGVGANFERYWYAKGYGLVAWENPFNGWQSWISKVDGRGSERLTMKVVPWLKLPVLPNVPDTPPVDTGEEPDTAVYTYPLTDTRWEKTWLSSTGVTGTNVRQKSTTKSTVIGSVSKDTPALILQDEKRIVNGEHVWYPVRLNTNISATHDTGDFSNSGWIRADVFTYRIYEEPKEPEEVVELETLAFLLKYNKNNEEQVLIVDNISNLIKLLEYEAHNGAKVVVGEEWVGGD